MFSDLSIIVPIAPGDTSWRSLVADLQHLPAGAELIFTGPQPPNLPKPEDAPGRALPNFARISWVRSPLGRARQMNVGARASRRSYLWFLHADSRVAPRTAAALAASLAQQPAALHYFDLAFEVAGFRRMAINNLGVWCRSHWLGLPFGDQGFCLPRQLFWELGGYDVRAPYGEDHLLVWSARRAGLPLRSTGAPIGTSPRKYQSRGWLMTTLRHLFLTAKQAWPEWWKTRSSRPAGRVPTLAIAAFVKTPGLSPVKTRLAAGIGGELARAVYERSVAAVASVMRAVVVRGGAKAYWAVAEPEGGAAWSSFDVLQQGSGELGARLATIYEALLQPHDRVPQAAVLIGADAPQIAAHHFAAARSRLGDGYDYVIGPANDGGFYLLAGIKPIPRRVFESVPYSAANTAAALVEQLMKIGAVAWLEPLSDIDTAEDLAQLTGTFDRATDLTPEQTRLAVWLGEQSV